ncbi:hypothetical protein D5S17_15735 [Pseudonocardiaceae bacterium YIM PH 21723]|nr:hypothetical protein D5S17_15735 [Pseudonocardiaceae bacterium YIM PH 21723]
MGHSRRGSITTRGSNFAMRRMTIVGAATICALAATIPSASGISGGSTLPDGQHTYTAKVETSAGTCSGVLVEPEWVLTAADCLPTEGALGTVTLNKTVPIASQVRRTDRNLSLVKLSQPITGITPVTLASKAPAAGDQLTGIGFGRTKTEWFPEKASVATFTVGAVRPTELDLTGDADTCKGDAGGPLLRGSELVGVHSASWQHGCRGSDSEKQGSVESRTDDINGWIRSQIPSMALTCKSAGNVFITGQNGALRLYQHKGMTQGTFDWVNGGGQQIGSGWLGARTIAGPDNIVWAFVETGELRRFHYLGGTAWEKFDGKDFKVVGSGWGHYSSDPAYRNRVTVDGRGDIYNIQKNGNLDFYRYNAAANSWTHRTITGGWDKYNLIVAAGDGVIYARQPGGELFRYVYDDVTGTLSDHGGVGVGWQMFNSIFSAGGDILYGARANNGGELLWYRYLPASKSWVSGNGKVVGSGWYGEYNLTAAPDSCVPVK